jgi:uncharacterized damage-inducible protein DinB
VNPTIEALIRIYERDLNKLEEEIRLYPDEALLWKVGKGITNPGGNLCLHLCGNLQYYLGTVLGQTGYKRNRPLEFAAKDVPISEILKEIQSAKKAVSGVLRNLKPEDLDKEYPEVVFDQPMTTAYFLVHLAVHLGYHLGQVNYHRRLLAS